uniref:Uncharacterized protein n=1 Tax=Anguilla anguilla TaxID=7936 RepID=A0A0E9QC09_ANGAN
MSPALDASSDLRRGDIPFLRAFFSP